MNYNSAGLNNLTDINSNVMNKFVKINHKNYKTISINSKAPSNYTKYNHSKDNIQQQQINNIQEKKRKNSNNKILNVKKEKKNYIPKIKSEMINTQLLFTNNESNLDNSNRHIDNRSNTNNLKNKKEIQIKNNSSSKKKSNQIIQKNPKDLGFIRKKLIIGITPNMISNNINSNGNRQIPRSNEILISNDNNNSGKKVIKRSNTNSNINDNIKNMNFFGEIYRYKSIIKILVFYIEVLNKKIKYFFNKNQVEKNNKIKELSLQNKFLLNENKNLKLKLLQFFYIIKSYINIDKNIYNEKYQKILKETLIENKFLRGINILPKTINNQYLSQLQNQIQIEKMKKELLLHKQFIKREESLQKNNNNKNNNKEANPFTNNESSLTELNPVSHKRQRTHFNLGKLNEENNNNIDSINNNSQNESKSSSNSLIEKKNEYKDDKDNKDKKSLILKHIKSKTQNQNFLTDTLKDISNYNKIVKKNYSNSNKNILGNKKENEINNKNMDDNNIISKNIKYMNKVNNNNIPINTNKIEYINFINDNNNKNNIDINNKNSSQIMNGNEMIGNKKQQQLYYRSSREKEKKKIIFNK